ncbi:MAG: acyl-CoA desaturase [Segetibacter sp.]|nr:acyl-CoA desaturase [Segetibacter sp.]
MATPKFATQKQSFHSELKRRINDYFTESNLSTTGNYKLYTKAAILLVGFTITYVHLVFFTPSTVWALLEAGLLGGLMSAIGFNIMHDGGHGSFSESPFINKCAAITLGILGGSPFMWNVKHNIIHHAFTNIDGVDDDIDARPFLRMASTQKKYKIHNFQHWYFWAPYCLLHFYWSFVSDYKKYFTKKIQNMPLKKMDTADHISFWTFKAIYYSLFIVIPIITIGFTSWLIGFLFFTAITGFILSIVFQLAHTVEHTHFPVPDVVTNKIEDEWAIHQLKTTANFATRSKLVSWYVVVLNFQIEHHLFPKISHIHYPEISKIIKQACHEYGVQYVEYKKMSQAVFSHIAYLKQMAKAS